MFSRNSLLAIAVFVMLVPTGCKTEPPPTEKTPTRPEQKLAVDKVQEPKSTEEKKTAIRQPSVGKDPTELRVEHRDGGVFIVNSAQKGKIIHSDGGVILVLEEKPSRQPEDTEQQAIEPDDTKPAPKLNPKADLSERIKDYFFAMDTLQVGPVGVKPKEFAEKLLGNMAKNNTEDLDKLVSSMKDIRKKMMAIDTPEPCRDHHNLSIELLEDSTEMMNDMAEAVKFGKKDQLNGLVSRATSLKAKTKKLERLREAIEKDFSKTAK